MIYSAYLQHVIDSLCYTIYRRKSNQTKRSNAMKRKFEKKNYGPFVIELEEELLSDNSKVYNVLLMAGDYRLEFRAESEDHAWGHFDDLNKLLGQMD